MVSGFKRYCPVLQVFVDVDEPCQLKPPSECLYKGIDRCPLVKERKYRDAKQDL